MMAASARLGLDNPSVISIDTSDDESENKRSCDSPPLPCFDPGFLEQYREQPPSVRPFAIFTRGLRDSPKNSDLEVVGPKNSDLEVVGPSPLPFEVNPMSILKTGDLNRIRKAYSIPLSVMLRIPEENERADSPGPNEITVYEAYFALGLRETIPSLIAQVATFFNISPSQLNPTAWRVLTAIQVFGELHSEKLGVKEVFYVHYLRAHGQDAIRCVLRKRPGRCPLVFDLIANEKRRACYEKDWKMRYLFMNVGPNPPFPITWCLRGRRPITNFDCYFCFPDSMLHYSLSIVADLTSISKSITKQCAAGKQGASRVSGHPPHLRSVQVLTAAYSLEKSTIWGAKMSGFVGIDGMKALERLNRIVTGRGSSSVVTPEPPSVTGKGRTSLKRGSASAELVTGPPKQPKKTATGGGLLVSDHAAPSGHAPIVDQLNANAFGRDVEGFEKLGISVIFPQAQAALIKTASLCRFAETQLALAEENKMKDSEVISALRLDFASATKRAEELSAAVSERDAQLVTLNTEKDVLTSRVESLEKDLQRERDNVEDRVDLASCCATIATEWRLIKDFKSGGAPKWDAAKAERNYREYMVLNAKAYQKEPPVFPDALTVFESDDPSPASVSQPGATGNNHPQDTA
ncbi:unnamed protein product [Microthlaspi erraticum]|uniref:Uncharacterized protein n=1 Tax=Microthlaspi erraticum TaxID=1685480 RepID=A0A6D2L7A3_9BRAS|nr:unnamed protein product [Microthlaspi erraticum]